MKTKSGKIRHFRIYYFRKALYIGINNKLNAGLSRIFQVKTLINQKAIEALEKETVAILIVSGRFVYFFNLRSLGFILPDQNITVL